MTLQSKRDKQGKNRHKEPEASESDELDKQSEEGAGEEEGAEEEEADQEEEEKEEEEEQTERQEKVREKVVAPKKKKVHRSESKVLIMFLFFRIQLSTHTLFVCSYSSEFN